MNSKLSLKQQEALHHAEHYGGRLMRCKGGVWTFEGALSLEEVGRSFVTPEWYCTTNTIFALVRRGYMMMDNFDTCSLIKPDTIEPV